MTRAAVKAAAAADALLAWLATPSRAGAAAALAKSEGSPEEAALAGDPDGDPGVPDARILDEPAPAIGLDTGVTQRVERAEAPHRSAQMRLAHTDWLHHRLAIIGAADQLAAFRRTAAGAGIIP